MSPKYILPEVMPYQSNEVGQMAIRPFNRLFQIWQMVIQRLFVTKLAIQTQTQTKPEAYRVHAACHVAFLFVDENYRTYLNTAYSVLSHSYIYRC